MRLEDQVCSLELSKRLKELDVKQDSTFYWEIGNYKDGARLRFSSDGEDSQRASYSAFTIAELGELLPESSRSVKGSRGWSCDSLGVEEAYPDTEADARAKILIRLLEKGIIKP